MESIVRDIRHLMCLRDSCVTHVNHNQNKVGNSLANFFRLESRTVTWVGSRPVDSSELAKTDCMDNQGRS